MTVAACTHPVDDNGYSDIGNHIAQDNVATVAGRLQIRLHDGRLTSASDIDHWIIDPDDPMSYSSVYWEVLRRTEDHAEPVRYEIASYWRGSIGRWHVEGTPVTWGRACGAITVNLASDASQSTATSKVIDCPDATPTRPTNPAPSRMLPGP